MLVATLKYSWKFSFDDDQWINVTDKFIDSDSNSVATFLLTFLFLST